MTLAQTNGRPRRVMRANTSHPITPEDSAILQAEREANYQKARDIFERVRPQLINNHYNWYITIDPDSEEYFIEKDYMTIFQRLRSSQSKGKTTTFRLNETGVCGRI